MPDRLLVDLPLMDRCLTGPASAGDTAELAPPTGGEKGQGDAAPSTQNLLGLLDQATVIIFAIGEGGLGNGTGFHIGDGLVLTNQHVIASADPQRIFLGNRSLGTVYPARIRHQTEGHTVGSAGFRGPGGGGGGGLAKACLLSRCGTADGRGGGRVPGRCRGGRPGFSAVSGQRRGYASWSPSPPRERS